MTTGAFFDEHLSASGEHGNSGASSPVISADGSVLVFDSAANNLVSGGLPYGLGVYASDVQGNAIVRVSATSGGQAGIDGDSEDPDVSSDGRYVAFESNSSNFASGASASQGDIYLKDLQTGSLTRLSTSLTGGAGNSESFDARVSGDGSVVVFTSEATNLTAGDHNGRADVFIWERGVSGLVNLSSLMNPGTTTNADSDSRATDVVFDRDQYGGVLAFETSKGLVAQDTNLDQDVYAYNAITGKFILASSKADGSGSNGFSLDASLSGDGRFVVFTSFSSDLVAGDTNNAPDVFVKDLYTGAIALVSKTTSGAAANGYSAHAAISLGGDFIVFDSGADNMVSSDANGGFSDVFRISNPLLKDTLKGGAGNDTYVINRQDIITEATDGGTDTVQSTISYTLGNNLENLKLVGSASSNGTGNSLDNTIYAGSGNNVLNGSSGTDVVSYASASAAVKVSLAITTSQATGGSGSDTLAGFEKIVGSNYADTLTGNAGDNTINGGAGVDKMTGGDGSDKYYVDNSTDSVSETNASASTGGTDTVYASLSYTLGSNVENLKINASGAINATGNTLNNVIYAGAGNNVMNGGSGTDTVSYSGASAAVKVSLAITTAQATGGSGSDTLTAIESLTGSNYDDTLTGSSANNTLNGGTGADKMTGGDGSDKYYVDNSTDSVSETNATASTGGTDIVYASLSYTLGNNVENLKINSSGTVNATGNSLANLIYAGAGNNVINGGSGTDTVSYSGASAAVTASLAVTSAQATGGSGSDTFAGLENLTGSNYNDKLTGSSGNNTLNGGEGSDTLTGGSGADNFLFASALNASTNKDSVKDFASASDRLTFDDAVFTAIGPAGALASSAFYAGTAAHDSSDRIVYDKASGSLYYDADGSGAAAKILFAALTPGAALVVSDLWVG